MVATDPLHAPEAVQETAFVVVHVNVPLGKLIVGSAESALTVSVTEFVPVPPAPVQEME